MYIIYLNSCHPDHVIFKKTIQWYVVNTKKWVSSGQMGLPAGVGPPAKVSIPPVGTRYKIIQNLVFI
jgi:hypothetical protein